MSPRSIRVLTSLALSLLSLALVAGATASPLQAPTCVGAATLDLTTGCVDRATTVYPSVTGEHNYEPPSAKACRPIRAGTVATACVLGSSESKAKLRFALIGDSHVSAWSAALGELGRQQGWRGTVFTGPGCMMTTASNQQHPILRAACMRAYRETMAWLRDHREIDFVLMTHKSGQWLNGPKATVEQRKFEGFKKTWKQYPRHVRRVIALTDTPLASRAQFDCLVRVVRVAQAPAGPQCWAPRQVALPRPDAAGLAARDLKSSRYRVVDMNDLICTVSLCYPAVGGVLVNLDVSGHMAPDFARTMEPQLLRRLGPLLPAPRKASKSP